MKRVVKYKSIDLYYSDVTQTYIGTDADEIDRIQEETEASMGNCHPAGISCIYKVEVLLDETDSFEKEIRYDKTRH